MTVRARRRLQTILGGRLMIVAAAVIVANIVLVAYLDASDRASLISDVATRELARLEAALTGAGEGGLDRVSEIYRRHPRPTPSPSWTLTGG